MAQERLRATDGATSLAFARRLFRGGVSAAVSVSETSPRVTEHTECGKKKAASSDRSMAGGESGCASPLSHV